jgi:hypothetical protein
VEKRISDVLDCIEYNPLHVPDDQSISTERITEIAMSKIHSDQLERVEPQPRRAARRSVRRFGTVAAAAVLTAILAGAALAVTGKLDFAGIADSLFGDPEASPYIHTGEEIAMPANDGDITVEPLAAFVDRKLGVYAQLKLTDPTGEYLSDSLIFLRDGFDVNTGAVNVTMDGTGSTVASMFISGIDADADEFVLEFDAIASGITHYWDEQTTGFDIGANIGITEPVVVPGAEFFEITGIELNGNTLTVSHRQSDILVNGWGGGVLRVRKPDGDIIESNNGASDAQTRINSDDFELDGADPNGLTLVWVGSRADKVAVGDWKIVIPFDDEIQPRTIDGTFEGNPAKVVIGATGVEIRIDADYFSNIFPYDIMSEGALTIQLVGGGTVKTSFSGSMYDTTLATFSYMTEFFNPADVVSVTFYGVTFGG